MSKPMSGYAFECAFLFFFVGFSATLGSFNFGKNEYVQKMCQTFKHNLPENDEDCEELLSQIAQRYYPGTIFEAENSLKKNVLGNNDWPKGERAWKKVFIAINGEHNDVEILLDHMGLKTVPRMKEDWLAVKQYMDTLLKNVFDLKTKEKIQSILEKDFASAKDNSDAFRKLASVYLTIPQNREMGLLQFLKRNEEPDDYRKAFYELAEEMLELIPICKWLGCATHLKYACELFYQIYFLGPSDTSDMNTLESNLEILRAMIDNRFVDLNNYLRHFATLAETGDDGTF